MSRHPARVKILVRSLADLAHPCELDDPADLGSFGAARQRAFEANPLRGSDDDPAQLLAVVGDRVIGRVDVFRGAATAFGETVPLLWGSALHVAPDYRATGAGAMLVLRMSALGSTAAGCGFSQAAIPIYRALRWTSFEFPRWVLVRHSRPVVDRLMARIPSALRTPASIPASFGVDRLLAAERLARRCRVRHRRRLVARQVGSLPSALDERLASPGADVFTHRSSRYVRWLVESTFGGSGASNPQKRLFVVEDEAGSIEGYFVLKVKRHDVASQRGYRNLLLGSIQDWFLSDARPGDVQALVLLAIDEFSRFDVDAIEVCATEHAVGAAARSLGFRRAGSAHFMFRPSRGSALASPAALDPLVWRLTPAEGDTLFA